MKFENHRPIYLQIIEKIKKDLAKGVIHPGDKLPSVREYALELKVNPNTVQKAYAEMERLGMAFTQRGIGRFIVDDEKMIQSLKKEMSYEIVKGFVENMKTLGYDDEEIFECIKSILGGQA